MTTASAFPLQWPPGWPRTPAAKRRDSRYQFKRSSGDGYRQKLWTFAEARDSLSLELDRFGARNIVLSTNFELTLQGLPRKTAGVDDQGVAVYFTLKGRPMVMACDLHVRAEENMRSLALALDALRTLQRHGGGVMMEKAFEGFSALPAPKSWREVLNDPQSLAEAEAFYKARIKVVHPDNLDTGSTAAAAELNAAMDQARRAFA